MTDVAAPAPGEPEDDRKKVRREEIAKAAGKGRSVKSIDDQEREATLFMRQVYAAIWTAVVIAQMVFLDLAFSRLASGEWSAPPEYVLALALGTFAQLFAVMLVITRSLFPGPARTPDERRAWKQAEPVLKAVENILKARREGGA